MYAGYRYIINTCIFSTGGPWTRRYEIHGRRFVILHAGTFDGLKIQHADHNINIEQTHIAFGDYHALTTYSYSTGFTFSLGVILTLWVESWLFSSFLFDR